MTDLGYIADIRQDIGLVVRTLRVTSDGSGAADRVDGARPHPRRRTGGRVRVGVR